MSATSEELAAQAEELEASIAFFRIDSGAASAPVRAPVKRAAPAPTRASIATKAPRKAVARAKSSGPKGKTVSAQQALAKGFALDLAKGGPDSEDAEFKAYG
jgi:methyl-accepting chemotaxis protein